MSFAHLHVHTYYSVLDGAASIPKLFAKAKENNQPALAITDHGNMYGIKEFFKIAAKYPEIKPIVGCEVYVAKESRFLKRGKEDQSSYHLILLAKNINGYRNLVKLCSYAYIEGMYYKPRIDRELLEKYHEDLICSSACLASEVARAITADDYEKAEETIQWYKNLFGDDYYLEVQRHESHDPNTNMEAFPMQQKVAEKTFEYAEKYNIKCIATNDVHFVSKEDAPAHDRLICMVTNCSYDEPDRLRYTWQEYLKTTEEMEAIFADHPEVISNTMEIVDKIERYDIDSGHILPIFPIPEEFPNSDDYLRHLTYEGARERYGENMDAEHTDRIDFELETIKKMGFPDYFLIVQDFINAARRIGVSVGPGRGSAAGSVVAYCLGITQIDPLKYDLLFERFLNPDRISMPDIDIDFDDEGRGKVLEYVAEKYGKDHVSHVVTFGTMATKSAIKDMARIEQLPLSESDRLAKSIPDKFPAESEGAKPPKVNIENCIKWVPEIKEAYESDNPILHKTIEYARRLDGTVRNTGVHACAIIIGRSDLTDYIPIATVKDKDTKEDMWVSQYEGCYIEEVGMLKMDFLGLKTLSIIKNALKNIKMSKGFDLDIAHISLEDQPTYDLFGRGDTVGTFQFESDGMRKWLRELKPQRFEDLIAMNALYRPGPLDYIPDFVDRKNGKKPIEYDLPEMEEFLSDTYGITVYQEQVMLLSQKLAGFTKGQADGLRKAMGKKLIDKMEELKGKFFEGGQKNGHPLEILTKIWEDWKAFAAYAFNKSHATCYAWVGYQTAFLKANYPAEYMAATLTKNINDMEEITKLMDEAKRIGVAILGPDVNESYSTFTVNKAGNIRFGMAGIKGVGAGAVDAIIEEREKAPFKDIFDFIERINFSMVNKKTIESLAYAGAFDSFEGIQRCTFFSPDAKGETFLETLVKYGNKVQNDELSLANSLFGGMEDVIKPPQPAIPVVIDYNKMELLRKEKELVGMYLSSHPLDIYKFEIEHFTTHSITQAQALIEEMNTEMNEKLDALRKSGKIAPEKDEASSKLVYDVLSSCNKEIIVPALVSSIKMGMSKNNRQYCTAVIEDYTTSYNLALFGKDFEKFLQYMQVGLPLLIKFSLKPRYGLFAAREAVFKGEHVEFEMRVVNMTLLSNTKDSFIKGISINLPLSEITKEFNEDFVKVCRKNKGNILLTLNVKDFTNQINVEYVSAKVKVDVSSDLLKYLDDHNLTYRIDKHVTI